MTTARDLALKAHGLNTFLLIDYGDVDSPRALCQFLYGSVTVPNLTKTLQQYASQWGIRVWPRLDVSEPIPGDMLTFVEACQQVPGGASQTVPQYLWNYETGFYPLLSGTPTYLPGSPTDPNANQNNREYWLFNNAGLSLSPALAFNLYPGVVIDSPGLAPAFKQAYDLINSTGGGLAAYVAASGAPLSDHPVNYGGSNVAPSSNLGEPGNSGGHNRNTYRRFTASSFYVSQVTTVGNHTKDGTACAVFYLKGAAGLTGTAQQPTTTEAHDIDAYHKLGDPFSGVTDGFGAYLGTANALLELANWQYLQGFSSSFMRTPITNNIYSQIPAFAAAPKHIVLNLPDAFALFQQTGGDVGTAHMNISNPGDNDSPAIGPAVGGSPFDNSASPQAVLNFFLSVIPNWSHHMAFEADTFGGVMPQYPAYVNQPPIVVRSAATAWPHFGSLMSKMVHPGGWYGYEQNQINLLFVDHYFNVPWNVSPFGLVSRMWGADSYSTLPSLAGFNVVYGLPNQRNDLTYTTDVAAVKSYVQNGGKLIVPLDLQSGWDSSVSDLLGVSSTAGAGGSNPVVTNLHPVLSPYAAADINLAMQGMRGNTTTMRTVLDAANVSTFIADPVTGPAAWTHKYGSGMVVTLPIVRYGDGFVVNGQGECDGIASGLGYLVLNSVLWLAGKPSPAIYLPRYVSRTAWANPTTLSTNGQGGHPLVSITANGTPSGQKLVWLSNNNTVATGVNVALSGSFFGFPNPWQLVDVNTGLTLNGTGDVVLNATVPAQDWLAFYSQQPTKLTSVLRLTAVQS